ncbi:hypothetical protein D3C80_1834070 [compost metagenome]
MLLAEAKPEPFELAPVGFVQSRDPDPVVSKLLAFPNNGPTIVETAQGEVAVKDPESF